MSDDKLTQSHKVALSLGSNKGDRLAYLRRAKEALHPYIKIERVSPVYEMTPAYASDQPLFYNAALCGLTHFDPMGLLYTLKDIELSLGRLPTFHFGPRVIDIDIIFFDDLVMHTPDLTIPHPFMGERAFVLKPLADICPDWLHPQTGESVEKLWRTLPPLDSIRAVDSL